MTTTLRKLFYAFPIRLIALHFRSHIVMIGLWLLLFSLMTGLFGSFYGFYYLLLTPEYLGEVNFWSFLITGAAFGVFFMVWNLTSYLLCAYRFPFLATLRAPFTKFSLNNSIIPLSFLFTYLGTTIWFQHYGELTPAYQIAWNVGGFLVGAIGMVSLLGFYLYHTNKDIAAFLRADKLFGPRGFLNARRLPSLNDIRIGATRWRVDTYLTETLRCRLVRSVLHYNQSMLEKVFRQNHSNALLVLIMVFLFLMLQGLLLDQEWVRIPTGATLFVLAGIVMALFGGIYYWFSHYGTLVLMLLLVCINFITSLGFFNYRNRAYGLNYDLDKRAVYSYSTMRDMLRPQHLEADKTATLQMLDRWLVRNRSTQNPKPKLVFLCVSGGGLRSATWTMQALQQADKATGGRLLRQSVLITGASGGMLGAAYLREVFLQQQNGSSLSVYDTTLIDDVSRDLLNPISFAIASNDLFFPLSTFKSGNYTYRKDRGYLFEGQLNTNYKNLLNKRLADYRQAEAEARIPMMVISPYIVNDTRRLLISPQGVNYLMSPPEIPNALTLNPDIDGVDFRKLCGVLEADSLPITTALRMSATYPLVLPNVWLPTSPAIEVMDAGFRDNYGISLAVRFSHVFRDWITENTGGLVIVQIRCWQRIYPIPDHASKGIIENVLTPGSVMGNLTLLQDFEHDNMLALLQDLFRPTPVDVVRFIYRPVKKEHEASLSLHLSKREKLDLLAAFGSPANQDNLKLLKQSLMPQ